MRREGGGDFFFFWKGGWFFLLLFFLFAKQAGGPINYYFSSLFFASLSSCAPGDLLGPAGTANFEGAAAVHEPPKVKPAARAGGRGGTAPGGRKPLGCALSRLSDGLEARARPPPRRVLNSKSWESCTLLLLEGLDESDERDGGGGTPLSGQPPPPAVRNARGVSVGAPLRAPAFPSRAC